jgi:hypothetical protein
LSWSKRIWTRGLDPLSSVLARKRLLPSGGRQL